MANEKPDQATAEPMIRFGDSWLPAHRLWHKMEVANMATDAIERFNDNFPHLASAETKDVVPLARRYLKGIMSPWAIKYGCIRGLSLEIMYPLEMM